MRLTFFRSALLLAGVLAAAPASAFVAVNGLRVVPEGKESFSVPLQFQFADQAFWCAAGDYVKVGLRLPGRTPIFLIGEPPRRAGQGMRFSLSPDGAASRTGVSIFGNSGPKNSVSASIARNLCSSEFPIFSRE